MTDQEALNRFEADLKFMQDISTPGHATNQMQMYERAIEALKYKIDDDERVKAGWAKGWQRSWD